MDSPVWQNGTPTIHAARALLAQALLVHVVVELVPVAHAFHGCAIHGSSREFNETLLVYPLSLNL